MLRSVVPRAAAVAAKQQAKTSALTAVRAASTDAVQERGNVSELLAGNATARNSVGAYLSRSMRMRPID